MSHRCPLLKVFTVPSAEHLPVIFAWPSSSLPSDSLFIDRSLTIPGDTAQPIPSPSIPLQLKEIDETIFQGCQKEIEWPWPSQANRMEQAFLPKVSLHWSSTLGQFFWSQTTTDEIQIALSIIIYETLGK